MEHAVRATSICEIFGFGSTPTVPNVLIGAQLRLY